MFKKKYFHLPKNLHPPSGWRAFISLLNLFLKKKCLGTSYMFALPIPQATL